MDSGEITLKFVVTTRPRMSVGEFEIVNQRITRDEVGNAFGKLKVGKGGRLNGEVTEYLGSG